MPPVRYARLTFAPIARAHLALDRQLKESCALQRFEGTSAFDPWVMRLGRGIDYGFGSQGVSLIEQSHSYHERHVCGPLKWYEPIYRMPLDHIAVNGVSACTEVAIMSFTIATPIGIGAGVWVASAIARDAKRDARLVALLIAAYSAVHTFLRGRGGSFAPVAVLAVAGMVSAYLGLPTFEPETNVRQAALDGAMTFGNFVWANFLPAVHLSIVLINSVPSSLGLGIKALLLAAVLACQAVGRSAVYLRNAGCHTHV